MNRGRIDKTSKNYGFLPMENTQGVSAEMDSGAEELERSGDISGYIGKSVLTFVELIEEGEWVLKTYVINLVI